MIDSHCHLDYPPLYQNLDNILTRAKDEGVKHFLTISTTLESFEKIKTIISKYSNVYGTLGIHPHESKDFLNLNKLFLKISSLCPEVTNHDIFKDELTITTKAKDLLKLFSKIKDHNDLNFKMF